jgi:hypothetical protein
MFKKFQFVRAIRFSAGLWPFNGNRLVTGSSARTNGSPSLNQGAAVIFRSHFGREHIGGFFTARTAEPRGVKTPRLRLF